MNHKNHIDKAFEQMLQFNSPEGRVAANQATIADRELRHKALVERRQAVAESSTNTTESVPTKSSGDFIQDLQNGLYGRLD